MRARWLVWIVLWACLSGCGGGDSSPASAAGAPEPALTVTRRVATPTPLRTATPSATATAQLLPVLPDLRRVEGDLGQQVVILEDGMPQAGSENYVIPEKKDLKAFAELTQFLIQGELRQAGLRAAENGYELIQYADREDGEAVLLRELKSGRRGWGLYVFRAEPELNLIIEAPHPLYDAGTPLIALEAYRALGGRALLIAGAHRDANKNGAADVAHQRATVFQAIHQELVRASKPVILQFHGFSSSRHDDYPEVVIGSNQPVGSELIERLASAFAEEEIEAGICDGLRWRDLCGETNVQIPDDPGVVFIHLELNEVLRAESTEVMTALRTVFTP